MKRLMVGTGFVVFLLCTKSQAQSGAVIPPADAVHASQASCVILKRMGRADRTKSRLSSLGISGKQFRYIEGNLPEGFSPHHKMTDHDVRNLQAHGAQVLVLESHYTSEDLKEARTSCQAGAGKTPNQVEAKMTPAPAPAPIASTPAPAPTPPTAKPPTPKTEDPASSASTTEPDARTQASEPKLPASKAPAPKTDDPGPSKGTTEAALVDVSSTPTGADVYIDEHFLGHTPATTIILMPGSHKIAVKKDGFVVWQKKLKLPSGRTNLDAALVPKTK